MTRYFSSWTGTWGILVGCSMLLAMAAREQAMAQAESPVPIPDEKYVTVKDGHLSLAGQRVRYWGWIGHFSLEAKLSQYYVKPGDSPEVRKEKVEKGRRVMDALAQRIDDLGFNLVRWWGMGDWRNPDYEIGDGSRADLAAYSFQAMEKRGIKVWMTAFNDFGQADPDVDAALVDDPATAEAWKQAVAAMKKPSPREADVGAWDARMRQVHLRRMKQIADWPNKYKGGLRLGDDPQMAVWELTNEEWTFAHFVNGAWQKLPKFFKDELQVRWSDFLKQKYQDDAGLTRAWGFLLPGEAIASNTILLAPLASPSNGKAFNDANPAAIAALTASQQTFSRDDFTRQRGADVLEFFSKLQIAYKTDRRDFAKGLGKSLRLCPMVLDTGDGFRIQSVLMQQQGDAVTMCSYIWQTAIDRQQPHFPFMSGLEEQPRLAMGIPWMEVGRVPGKPFFVYEFQMNNPDKYRAEVPFRIAALGAIQDWDIINFHLFGRPSDPDLPEPYSAPIHMSYYDGPKGSPGASVEGVHFKNDEIYAAAMKTAGLMFREGVLDPVKNPTVMTFGSKSLYDPRSASYGQSFGDLGLKIAPTAWRYGCYMQVDPTVENDSVSGRTVERGLDEANPIRPTDQITFDWQRGFMKLDAPAGVSWTGFFARQDGPVKFADGIELDKVSVINDPGVNYPVGDDELYISFAAVAEDGKPLAESKKVVVSLVSTSFNNGFKLVEENVARGDMGHTKKPYQGMTRGGGGDGKPPVAYVRAGATVIAPPLAGMKYKWLNWHFKPIGEGEVGADGKLVIPADKPIFTIELTR